MKERGGKRRERKKEPQGRRGQYNHAVLYEKNKTGRAGDFNIYIYISVGEFLGC